MMPRSLVSRVALLVVGIVTALGLVAIAAGSYTMQGEINESLDASLEQTARQLLPIVIDDIYGREAITVPRALSSAGDDGEEMIFQVLSGDGRLLMHSDSAPPKALTSDLHTGFSTSDDWRTYTLDAISGSIILQVSHPLAKRREDTIEAISGFVIPTAVFIPLGGLLAWMMVAYALRPIGRLRMEIADRHGARLAPVDAADLPPELAGIARSVNRLMRRLSMAIDAEREFTANAAHELRTPLAGALAQTERLLAETSDDTARARAMRIHASLSGLAALAEKLLQLARADAGVATAQTETDLAPALRLVVQDLSRLPLAEGRLALTLPPDGVFTAAIDPDSFAILVRNLVENAVLHGTASRPVSIVADADGTLTVANDGACLPPDQLVKLTKRFHRAEPAGSGTGLGLAIVDKIARQTGATLTLSSPVPGRPDGFQASVRFPRLQAAAPGQAATRAAS